MNRACRSRRLATRRAFALCCFTLRRHTESNGGFKNITVKDCVFESCRGFALETVDGGSIEDITFTGVTMRDIRNAPFFLRLGARLRAPAGTSAGTLRRVIISEVICDAPTNDMPAIIAGIPGHPIEDVTVSDVSLVQRAAPRRRSLRSILRNRSGSIPSRASLGRCRRWGCWSVMRGTLGSVTSKSPAFKPTRGRSFGLTTLQARPFLASSCHLWALRLHETNSLLVSASPGLPNASLDRVADGWFP
jgi:hypothetical protein